MEGHHILRRIIHSMAWVVLVYYLLPETIVGYSRQSILIVVVVFVLAFEGLRLYKGWKIFGMRDYETKQIAAYAWAAMAAGIALVIFPMHLAVLCLIGMGIVDPLIGELRAHAPRYYPYVPFIVWFLIGVVVFYLLTDFSWSVMISFSILGSAVAIAVEFPSVVIDDDFLMIVVPLLVLYPIELLLL